MKTCFKCNRHLPLSDYYVHPQMADGHLNKCKDCARKDAEVRRKKMEADPDWMEKERARHRAKAKRQAMKRPDVLMARKAVRKLGVSSDYHWHHWSYNKGHETDCIKLLPQEHRRAHRFLIFDEEALMYRRCDTMELLDTRERHEAFLNEYVSTKPL